MLGDERLERLRKGFEELVDILGRKVDFDWLVLEGLGWEWKGMKRGLKGVRGRGLG